jgi:hypothetical protein
MPNSSSPNAQGKIKIYRAVLFVSIALNLTAAIFGLLWPDAFTNILGQPNAMPQTWPRLWGAQLIGLTFLYFPGYWRPAEHRWPNWCGIVIRLSFALFFFSQGDGFVRMGIVDGIAGLALLLTYLPVVRSS